MTTFPVFGIVRHPARVPLNWIEIRAHHDLVLVRRRVRVVGEEQGLSRVHVEALATAANEIGGNVIVHAGGGVMSVERIDEPERSGVAVSARDYGPGIADLQLALQDGYSSRAGLGLGLPSAKRLVHDFAVESERGSGTVVVLHMWAS